MNTNQAQRRDGGPAEWAGQATWVTAGDEEPGWWQWGVRQVCLGACSALKPHILLHHDKS